MTTETKRIYAVSSGDGNNGVSHMYPDYYVMTNDPWRLAELAIVSQFKTKGKPWAKRNADIDGEAEHMISAVLYNPPCEDTEDGEYPETDDDENAEDGRNWSETNGAWMIVEIFPEDEPNENKPIHDSLEDCFEAEDLALVPAE